jgi:murein L,D-transpeptidase YcbB/YkuD
MQLKTFRGATLGLGLMLAAAAMAEAQETGSLPPAPVAAVGDQANAPVPSVAEPEGGALRFATPAPGTFAALVVSRLAAEPANLTEPEQKERQALAELYAAREGKPLWLDHDGAFNERARSAKAALLSAGDWGLQAADFALPRSLDTAAAFPTAETRADAELALSLAVLKYARHARGGRILDPTAMLSSYLDRKPQLIDAKAVLERVATADDAGTALTQFHPRHAEFERLRHAYLAARGAAAPKGHARGESAEAKRLLANMEEWRWMPADMGDLYVQVNIPEFLLRVVKNGEVIHTEKIVAGEIGKQTPIFSRPLKKIVFRPKWRVPESIKVRELWPSMLKGGGQMTAFGLQLETKDGQPLDWRKIDWTKADIRQYEVVQPPGPKSVLGVVKFAFPSQHTVYMHDTQDKYMFAASQRTFSHGCMRVRNPLLYAEVLLREDKGWDGAKIRELAATGPLDNQVEIARRIPVHMTYFTARSGEGGRIETFRDVYGHERRITQALEGKWAQIAKGRDHLAPVELDLTAGVTRATRNGARVADNSKGGPKPAATIMDALFGGGF